MTDEEIISLYFARDERALRATDEKYHGLCAAIAVRMLGSFEDAEECVNDTWFSAWQYIPPKRPAVLGTFLARITRGHALSRLRRTYAQRRPDRHMAAIGDELDTVSTGEMSMEDSVIDRMALTELLRNFLTTLSAEDRDIFLRRYWFMDSVEEIAQRHGIPTGTVKSSLYRSRKKLKKRLQQKTKQDDGKETRRTVRRATGRAAQAVARPNGARPNGALMNRAWPDEALSNGGKGV